MRQNKEMDYLTMTDLEYRIHYAETINEWHQYEQENNKENE